jgi:hypothetical protein
LKSYNHIDKTAVRLPDLVSEIRSLTEKVKALRDNLIKIISEDKRSLNKRDLREQIVDEIKWDEDDRELRYVYRPMTLKNFLRRSDITVYQISFAFGTWFRALEAADCTYRRNAPARCDDELIMEMDILKEILK